MKEATTILESIQKGDSKATGELLDLVYDELRLLAARKISREAPGHTLQPTALVHEAWLRLVGEKDRHFENRTHFFFAAAEAMRRILIDSARRGHAQRHGGGYERVHVEEGLLASPVPDEELLALNDALEEFTLKFPVHSQVVKLRYFAGMTNEEISEVIGTSLSTVKNYWIFSKAWLFDSIKRT